jgi:heat shock 70kDa protein 1/2/6/8
LEGAVNGTIQWLDNSQEDGYEEKQKELEGVANPIMQKLFSVAGGSAGSAPGDFSGAGREKGPMCGGN